jgi:RNA-directed DNA polymerase
MLDHIPTDKEVLRKWLKAGFMEDRKLFATEAGTPQGGIISPTLANLTLDGLELLLKQTFRIKKVGGTQHNPKVNFVRYADDFIITGSSKELLEDEVKPLVEWYLLERGLQLSPEKTCITHIEDGFDFLGQNLRRHGKKVLTTPSKKNMHAFLEKVRGAIKRNSTANQANLIGILNPVIRGWANYHRHIVASSAFQRAEMVIWRSLWRWAKHRHWKKPTAWIASRYWHRLGNGRRMFAVMAAGNVPCSRAMVAWLVNPTKTPIVRHVKVRSNANPFDPGWRSYFETRKSLKRASSNR